MIDAIKGKVASACLCVCLSLATVQVMAASSIDSLSEDDINAVAKSQEWHRLLHFQDAHWWSGAESQVDDDDFFLAADGNRSPKSELLATLHGFYAPLPAEPNQHAICRFPARWDYLSKVLALPAAPFANTQCTELSVWRESIKPHSVTLVFASAYLNSPSSMYGHTLLRIDAEDVSQGSKWLSYAVNFGAEVNADDNSLFYAYKGLFGGYLGFFSIVPYYQKIKDYNRIENRDLWEYNLNLSEEETNRLVMHLWELRNIDFDYYFFDENCSYRLLELLEVARPSVSLREGMEIRAIPIDTVRSVIQAQMVESIEFRPSQALKIESTIAQLTPDLQRMALSIAAGESNLEDQHYQSLTPDQQALVLRVAYQHLRYQERKQVRTKLQARRSLALLSQLSTLPKVEINPQRPDYSPEQGHKTLLVGVAAGAADHEGYSELRLRASYHDLQDNAKGYLDGAAISIGELNLRKWEGDQVKIEDLNLISIDSHSVRDRFFKPLTWRVQFGMDRVYTAGDDDLTTQLNGGVGVTYGLTHLGRYYFMLSSRVEYNELVDQNWNLGVGGLTGVLLNFPNGTFNLETNYYEFSSGNSRYGTKAIVNIPWQINHGLRLSVAHQRELEAIWDEWTLEYRYYF